LQATTSRERRARGIDRDAVPQRGGDLAACVGIDPAAGTRRIDFALNLPSSLESVLRRCGFDENPTTGSLILTDGGRQEQQIFADLAENKHVLKRRSLER
jgi:hypothetical protein